MFMKLMRIISSRWVTSTALLVLAGAYMRFTSGENPFEQWGEFVLHTPGGQFLYTLLVISLITYSIRAIVIKLAHQSITPETIKSMDAYIKLPVVQADPIVAAMDRMGKMGFGRPIQSTLTSVSSQRGRYSFIPGTIFRAGLIILMTAVLFSAQLRQTGESVFTAGEEAILLGEKIRITSIKPGFPDEYIKTGEQSPFRLRGLSTTVESGGDTYTVTGWTPTRVNGIYLRVIHVGFMQPISGATQRSAFEWNVFLEVLPPGKVDSGHLLSRDISLSFVLAPEKIVQKELFMAKRYNLNKPAYNLTLLDERDEKISRSAKIAPREHVTLGDVKITLGETMPFITVLAVSDPALRWLYIGLGLTVFGAGLMLTRLFWYDRRMYIFRTYEAVLVGYSEEFYKWWGIMRFYRVAGEDAKDITFRKPV